MSCSTAAGWSPSASSRAPVLAGADQVVLGGPTAPGRPARSGDLAGEPTPLERNRLSLVLVGRWPLSRAEVNEALGVDVLAHLPWDPDAAEGLVSAPGELPES